MFKMIAEIKILLGGKILIFCFIEGAQLIMNINVNKLGLSLAKLSNLGFKLEVHLDFAVYWVKLGKN